MRLSTACLACATAVLMLAAVSNARAGRLSLSPNAFRIVWSSLEFEAPAVGVTINCPVTLEGSYHSSTMAKVAGALIGSITSGSLQEGACTGGRASILRETLPWHIHYEAFEGTLPNITGITDSVTNAGF